jgi:site-specific recombinase XerD
MDLHRKTATRTATGETTKKRPAPKPVRGVFEHPVGSDIWWVNYYVAGRRHREKVGTRGKAVALYQKRKSDARAGIKLPESLRVKKAVLFSDLAKDAMVYSKAHKRSHRGDLSNLNSLLPVFGKMNAEDVTQQKIAAYLNSRTDLKPASLNRYRSTIRNGKVKTNPARLVRLRREDNARIRFLTFQEEALIRSIIRKRCPTHEPDFVAAIETGMRLREQHTSEWPCLSFERRQIELIDTKNGKSRVIPLSDEAFAAFKECAKPKPASRKKNAKPRPITQRIFLSRYGQPMENPRAWFELVMAEAIKKDAKLSDVTWHVLRHTYISRLVMAGVDLRTVAELAGHKTLSMTMRYAHLAPEHKQDAMRKLSDYRKKNSSVRKSSQVV